MLHWRLVVKSHVCLPVLIVGAFAAAAAVGQPGMTTCAGVNHLTGAWSGGYPVSAYRLAVRIQVPSTLAIDAIEWFFLANPSVPPGGVGIGTVAVHAALANGMPAWIPSASATMAAGIRGSWWSGPVFAPPAVLAPGTWWISFSVPITSMFQLVAVENSPPGPDATPYALDMFGGWSMGAPPQRFKIRLRSAGCASQTIPFASVVSYGLGCTGNSGPLTIVPAAGQLPVLGNSGFALELWNGTPSAPAAWFVSTFVEPNSIGIPGGCAIHLEPAALLGLLSLGLNPVAAGSTNSAGAAVASFPIPADPALGGRIFAVQATVADFVFPAGFTTSNALQLTLGL